MKEPARALRETDEEARALGRKLIRSSRYASIAVLEPDTGYPFASRVLTGTDIDGAPVILISALAVHSTALRADPRASLLFGQAGKGDPLAHARITLRCKAEAVDRTTSDHARIRARFVARHPKSALYVDFGDFAFFRMQPITALLNGGFGKAYLLDAQDIVISSPETARIASLEQKLLQQLSVEHSDEADVIAGVCGNSKRSGWSIAGIDASGMDLANGDELLRVEFTEISLRLNDLAPVIADVLMKSRII